MFFTAVWYHETNDGVLWIVFWKPQKSLEKHVLESKTQIEVIFRDLFTIFSIRYGMKTCARNIFRKFEIFSYDTIFAITEGTLIFMDIINCIIFHKNNCFCGIPVNKSSKIICLTYKYERCPLYIYHQNLRYFSRKTISDILVSDTFAEFGLDISFS